MRILKVLSVTLGSIVGLAALVLTALFFVGEQTYKNLFAHAVEQFTDRAVVIDGDLHLSLFPVLQIQAEELKLANAPWSERAYLAEVGHLDARLDLRALFDGILDLKLALEDSLLSIERNAAGESNWPFFGNLQDDPGDNGYALRPRIREISMRNVRVPVSDATSGAGAEIELRDFSLGEKKGELVVRLDGRIDSTPLTLTGSLGRAEAITENRATELRLGGNAGDAVLAVKGTWGPLVPYPTLHLEAQLRAGSPRFMDTLLPAWLAGLGSVDSTLTLAAARGTYALPRLQVALRGDDEWLMLSGRIGDLEHFRDVRLDVEFETPRFRELAAATDLDLPLPVPHRLAAVGRLEGDAERLSAVVQDLTAHGEGVVGYFRGDIGSLRSWEGVKGTIKLEAQSSAALGPFFGLEIPELGRVALSAEVDNTSGLLRAHQIDFKVTENRLAARVTGKVDDLANMAGIRLELALETASLAVLGPLLGREFADTPPFTADMKIDLPLGFAKAMTLEGKLRGEGMGLSAEGRIGNLAKLSGVDLSVSADARSPRLWGELFGVDIPADTPIGVEGRLRSIRGGYRFGDAIVSLNSTRATGDLAFRQPREDGRNCWNVDGKVRFDNLDLRKLLAADVEIEEIESPFKKEEHDQDKPKRVITLKIGEAPKLFSTVPFPPYMLAECDVALELYAQKLLMADSILKEVEAHLKISGGRLSLDPIRADPRSGRLEGALRIDTSVPPYAFSIRMEGEDLNLARASGTYNLDVALRGRGDSVAELMGSLNGGVTITAGDVVFDTRELTSLERTVLQSLLTTGGLESFPEIECLFAHLDFKDGVVDARRQVVVQATHITWFIGGVVDLGREELEVYARSAIRQGVDLLGDFASLVQVVGSLSEPRLELDPAGVLQRSMEFTASVASGGLVGLLLNLFDLSEANRDVCRDAFGNAHQGAGENSHRKDAPRK